MGLDMYAYIAARAGQRDEYYDGSEFDEKAGEFVNDKVTKPFEIAYWRKHPNLHGWMQQLWERRGRPGERADYPEFNGIEVELTWEDIDELEQAVLNGLLPDTDGFFFGDPSDDYYREQDLAFIKEARSQLFLGLRVFYNSSW